MKKLVLAVVFSLVLISCGPGPTPETVKERVEVTRQVEVTRIVEGVVTVLAERTVIVERPVTVLVTSTPNPTYTPHPTYTPLPSPSPVGTARPLVARTPVLPGAHIGWGAYWHEELGFSVEIPAAWEVQRAADGIEMEYEDSYSVYARLGVIGASEAMPLSLYETVILEMVEEVSPSVDIGSFEEWSTLSGLRGLRVSFSARESMRDVTVVGAVYMCESEDGRVWMVMIMFMPSDLTLLAIGDRLAGSLEVGSSGPTLSKVKKTAYSRRFDVDITVLRNSDLRIEETHQVEFSGGPFHAGWRTVSKGGFDSLGDVDVWEGDNQFQQVSSGEAPATFIVEDRKDEYFIEWYFPQTADSAHTFTVAYVVKGGLRIHEDGDELWWKALPAGWVLSVGSCTVTVQLPGEFGSSELGVETLGMDVGHEVVSPGVVRFQGSDRLPGQGLEVRVRFPHGEVQGEPRRWQTLEDGTPTPVPFLHVGEGARRAEAICADYCQIAPL
jgi:hypothetical protein